MARFTTSAATFESGSRIRAIVRKIFRLGKPADEPHDEARKLILAEEAFYKRFKRNG
jgi:hypothetical protein